MPNIFPVVADDVAVISAATASYSARGSVDISIFTSILIYLRSGHLPLIWATFTILYHVQNFKPDLPRAVAKSLFAACGGSQRGKERGHLALRQGAAAPWNPAWALDVPILATALLTYLLS